MFKKFITILIFASLTLSVIVIPQMTQAAESLDFTPQITIPGSEFQDGQPVQVGAVKKGDFVDAITEQKVKIMQSTLIGRYIRAIYNYAIGIVGILALIMVMIGGLLWLTSGGNQEKVSQAKSFIGGALAGLALLLLSYTLLSTINSKLVEMPSIDTVILTGMETGCCSYTGTDSVDYGENITNVECAQKEGSFDKNKTVNQAGTKCLENGCCAITNEYYSDGNVNGCHSTNEEICNELKKKDGEGGKHEFFSKDCHEYTFCKNKEIDCDLVAEASHCQGGAGSDCYCYGGQAYFGKGQEGEVCGDGNTGINSSSCMPQSSLGTCPGNYQRDRGFTGRSCEGTTILCCY